MPAHCRITSGLFYMSNCNVAKHYITSERRGAQACLKTMHFDQGALPLHPRCAGMIVVSHC